MLAHKEEFFYQNPANLGENLFVWIPPIGHSLLPQGKKKKPDVSGEDASVYWYKTHIHYDYSKEPNVQHAHAGNILATFTLFLSPSLPQKWSLNVAKIIHSGPVLLAFE